MKTFGILSVLVIAALIALSGLFLWSYGPRPGPDAKYDAGTKYIREESRINVITNYEGSRRLRVMIEDKNVIRRFSARC